MTWMQKCRWMSLASMAGVLILGGCIEYRIETTLNANGSGVRHEKMIVEEFDDEADNAIFRADFGYLLFVTEDYRWSQQQEVQDGDTLHVFLRETRINDFDSWAELSGMVHIAGATDAAANARVGNVRLGDVHFRNRVRVERGRVTEGTSYTYRETFYWENLAEALVEYIVQAYAEAVVARYSELSAAERGELVGLVTGSVWFAVGQGLFEAEGDEEEELVAALAERTAGRAVQIVRRRYANARQEFFADLLKEIYDDDAEFEAFVTEQLPGVQLAINSEIVFWLTMPGRVLTSNAHDRDGNTLIWEFAPAGALTAPLEIVAEAIVER